MNTLSPKSVWLFFVSSLVSWLFAVFAVVAGIMFTFDTLESGLVGIGGWLFVAVATLLVLSYIWARLTYHFYRYELHEDGFRKEHGIIWKKYVTIPYDRIQNIDIYRGLLARLLGLSDIQIQTAGGIAAGSYGATSEGRLPGLSREVAEQIRNELVRRAKSSRGQGL